MKEYDRFQKGAANSNTSTAILQRQLENKDKNGNYHEYKIIITTIQKLDGFIRKNKGHEVFDKHIVLIFDEWLKDKETHIFIENSFHDGVLKTTGTDVDAIMPAVSRFGSGSAGNRSEMKKRVIDRLLAYFEKYLDLVGMK